MAYLQVVKMEVIIKALEDGNSGKSNSNTSKNNSFKNKQNTSNSEEIVYFTPKVRVITLQNCSGLSRSKNIIRHNCRK